MIENNKFCISAHYRHVRDEVCIIHVPKRWNWKKKKSIGIQPLVVLIKYAILNDLFVKLLIEVQLIRVKYKMQDFCNLEKVVNSVIGEFKEFRISKGKKVWHGLFL